MPNDHEKKHKPHTDAPADPPPGPTGDPDEQTSSAPTDPPPGPTGDDGDQ